MSERLIPKPVHDEIVASVLGPSIADTIRCEACGELLAWCACTVPEINETVVVDGRIITDGICGSCGEPASCDCGIPERNER